MWGRGDSGKEWPVILMPLSLGGDDCGGNLQELVCLERGSTDQATVNAILDGVITGVASVHAAAVQQRDIFCGVTEDASQGLKYHLSLIHI